MSQRKYVFGPVPSRRLGRSLGISPIPEKTCNYSCVYCQLGRTGSMRWQTENFYPVKEILAELDDVLKTGVDYDVVTVVGEGEPTLYSDLGPLIRGIKERQDKPVCVITNSANIHLPEVRAALREADIVMPSLDGVDRDAWRAIHRPSPHVSYDEMMEGLREFRSEYKGAFWLEWMLVKGMNDSKEEIERTAEAINALHPDRVFINTPVRAPAEPWVDVASEEAIALAARLTGGTPIDELTHGDFDSAEADPVEAVASICLRHPMNRFEILHFLEQRGVKDTEGFFRRLTERPGMVVVEHHSIPTWVNRAKEKGGSR